MNLFLIMAFQMLYHVKVKRKKFLYYKNVTAAKHNLLRLSLG